MEDLSSENSLVRVCSRDPSTNWLTLETSIQELPLSFKSWKALELLGIGCVRELLDFDVERIDALRGYGQTTQNNLCEEKRNILRILWADTLLHERFAPLLRPIAGLVWSAKESKSLHQLGVARIGDFLTCDFTHAGLIPSVEQSLSEKQNAMLRAGNILTSDIRQHPSSSGDVTGTGDFRVPLMPWNIREISCLQRMNIRSMVDFLECDLSQWLDTCRGLGEKTYHSLLDKQHQLRSTVSATQSAYPASFRFPTNGEDSIAATDRWREFPDGPPLSAAAKTFLQTFRVGSVRAFAFMNLNILRCPIRSGISHAILNELISAQEMLCSGDPSMPSDDAESEEKKGIPGLSPNMETLFRQWRMPCERSVVRHLPFFSGLRNEGFDQAEFHETFYPEYSVEHIRDLPTRMRNLLRNAGIRALGELLLIPCDFFERVQGCGLSTLKKSQKAILRWLSASHSSVSECGEHSSDFSSEDAFLRSMAAAAASSDPVRMETVVRDRRNGKTLQECAESLGLTRERVRQIESRFFAAIPDCDIRKMTNVISATLESTDGFLPEQELRDRVAHRLEWPEPCSRYLMGWFLKQVPNEKFQISDGGKYIRSRAFLCAECRRMDMFIHSCSRSSSDCIFSVGEILQMLENTSESPCVKCSSHGFQRSLEFIEWKCRNSIILERMVKEGRIWLESEGVSLQKLVERVLEAAGSPRTYRQIHEELRAQEITRFSDRQIRSAAGNMATSGLRIFLWDRGAVFVHRNFIPQPMLLETMIDEIVQHGKEHHIPQLRLDPFFRKYEAECHSHGLPTPYALFAALKLYASSHRKKPFEFLRTPYIGFSGTERKLSNQEVLENYVIRHGNHGLIARKQLEQFAKTMGIAGIHFINTCVHSQRLVFTRDGIFHLDFFNPDHPAFREIEDFVAEYLSRHETVSAKMVFQKKAMLCAQLEIADPRMLYSLLESLGSELFQACRFPYFARDGFQGMPSLRNHVSDYVRQQNRPVSRKLIIRHFAENSASSRNSLNAVFPQLRGEILQYTDEMVIHRDLLGWSDDRQRLLESLACDYWHQARRGGRWFARLDDLLEEMADHLPELEWNLSWKPRLLYSLLSTSPQIRMFGNACLAYSLQEDEIIRDDVTLLRTILTEKFGGGASRADFSEYLRTEGIIRGQLMPSMLPDQREVTITEYEVSLTKYIICDNTESLTAPMENVEGI